MASTDCRLRGDFSLKSVAGLFESQALPTRYQSQPKCLVAGIARISGRRRSSARRRQCSTVTCFLPTGLSPSLYLRSETQDLSNLPASTIFVA